MKSHSGFSVVQWIILAIVVALVLTTLGLAGQMLLTPQIAQVPVPGTALAQAITPSQETRPTTHAALATPTDGALIVFPSVQPAEPTSCLQAGAERAQALVTKVVDGVTLQVEVDGKAVTVRYLGVDLVGSGAEATAYNREHLEGKTVTLVKDAFEVDTQGALMRYVLAGNEFVNYALIRAGLASTALYPPGASCAEVFVTAERQASAGHLGFWGSVVKNLPTLPALPVLPTGTPPCNCSRTYTCSEFSTHASAQACFDACGDYRNVTLDPDHNGQACENLP